MVIKTLNLTSPVVREEEMIPRKYCCDGINTSIPLTWDQSGSNIKCFALIMDDPDAAMGTFTHWAILNIPVKEPGLSEGIPTDSRLANGTIQGMNSAKKIGYIGPCPPPGDKAHHYHFNLYALDSDLKASPGASKEDVMSVMKNHVLAKTELIAIYKR
jgi:Raf kinase inhibitor-like YbhB/YbcL family protein